MNRSDSVVPSGWSDSSSEMVVSLRPCHIQSSPSTSASPTWQSSGSPVPFSVKQAGSTLWTGYLLTGMGQPPATSRTALLLGVVALAMVIMLLPSFFPLVAGLQVRLVIADQLFCLQAGVLAT